MQLNFDFKDPLEISEQLARLGQHTRITQMENGSGQYDFSFARSDFLSIAQIGSTKTLLYEGWGTNWSIDFNWVVPIKKTNNILGHCDGYEMTSRSLGGLRTNHSNSGDAWGKYSNQCLSFCVYD